MNWLFRSGCCIVFFINYGFCGLCGYRFVFLILVLVVLSSHDFGEIGEDTGKKCFCAEREGVNVVCVEHAAIPFWVEVGADGAVEVYVAVATSSDPLIFRQVINFRGLGNSCEDRGYAAAFAKLDKFLGCGEPALVNF